MLGVEKYKVWQAFEIARGEAQKYHKHLTMTGVSPKYDKHLSMPGVEIFRGYQEFDKAKVQSQITKCS